MAIVYLNDVEKSYVDFKMIISRDKTWLCGIESGGHRIDIPVRSILYVDEGGYEMEDN